MNTSRKVGWLNKRRTCLKIIFLAYSYTAILTFQSNLLRTSGTLNTETSLPKRGTSLPKITAFHSKRTWCWNKYYFLTGALYQSLSYTAQSKRNVWKSSKLWLKQWSSSEMQCGIDWTPRRVMCVCLQQTSLINSIQRPRYWEWKGISFMRLYTYLLVKGGAFITYLGSGSTLGV